MTSPRPFPLIPAGICLAGLLFCLWVMNTGGEALCLTDGCALFQDLRIAGASLWHAGAALFSLLLGLALLRQVRAALLLASAALAADTFLLAVMLFTAPCVNCLLVGALIASAWLSFRRAERPLRSGPSMLATVWLAFLLFNAGTALRDLSVPWSPLPYDREQTSVHIYFSPSCRACQTLISSADTLRDAAWFPVAEDERDLFVIEAMASLLAAGLPLEEAVREAQEAVPPLPDFAPDAAFHLRMLRPDRLLLQFRLWKNHARVLDAGSDRLPFVQFMGLPSFLRDAPENPAPRSSDEASGAWQMPAELTDIGVAGFCSGASEAPCENASPFSGDGLGALPHEGPIDTSGLTP